MRSITTALYIIPVVTFFFRSVHPDDTAFTLGLLKLNLFCWVSIFTFYGLYFLMLMAVSLRQQLIDPLVGLVVVVLATLQIIMATLSTNPGIEFLRLNPFVLTHTLIILILAVAIYRQDRQAPSDDTPTTVSR